MGESKMKVGDTITVGSDEFEVITVSAEFDTTDQPFNFKYEIQLKSEAESKRSHEASLAAAAALVAAENSTSSQPAVEVPTPVAPPQEPGISVL